MEFPSTQVPEALRQRVVARIPMVFRYGGQGTPEAGYSTLGAIARGVRTSTLRRANSIPARVRPGQVVEFFDNDRNRSVLAVVTGRGRVDLTEPGLHERLSRVEGWTPAFLRSYLKPAQSWEQITYQPLVTRAEGRVSPNHPFTPELIDSVIRGAYGREMAPDEAASRSVGAGGSRGRVRLTATGPYTAKDQRKADQATKFIGRGSPASSTTRYAGDFGGLANTGTYAPDDVVFISAEGNRRGRIGPDFDEINRALSAGVTILTDDPENRNRNYNIGERQVAQHLAANGYLEVTPGRWTPGEGMTAAGGSLAGSPPAITMESDSVAVPVSRSVLKTLDPGDELFAQGAPKIFTVSDFDGLVQQGGALFGRGELNLPDEEIKYRLQRYFEATTPAQAVHIQPLRGDSGSVEGYAVFNADRMGGDHFSRRRGDGSTDRISFTKLSDDLAHYVAGREGVDGQLLEVEDKYVPIEKVRAMADEMIGSGFQPDPDRNAAFHEGLDSRELGYQPFLRRDQPGGSPAAGRGGVPRIVESVVNQNPELRAAAENVFGDGARAAEEAPAPGPGASKLPELQLDRENFSALSGSGKLDGIGLRPEIVPGLADVGEQRLVVYNGNRALEVDASRDPKTGLYTFKSLGRRKREIPVEDFSEPPPEVIESTRNDTSSAPPSAATGDGVPEVVQEAIVSRHPELKEEAQRVFPAKTSNKKKPAQTDQPASSVPPPGEESLDFNAARKLTRSQKVVATLAGAENEINRLRAEIGDLHQARESAPTQEVYNKLTAQLDELRGQHAELESRYTAAQEAMETMVSKEEYDKAVARHVAEAVIPDEQKMKANWRLAKRYGLPALAGVLGVAAGGALFGDGDEVVVVDSGSGRQN